jgi:hypothetical protein
MRWMPVILSDMIDGSIPEIPIDPPVDLLRPFPAERTTTWRVSPAVGNTKNDSGAPPSDHRGAATWPVLCRGCQACRMSLENPSEFQLPKLSKNWTPRSHVYKKPSNCSPAFPEMAHRQEHAAQALPQAARRGGFSALKPVSELQKPNGRAGLLRRRLRNSRASFGGIVNRSVHDQVSRSGWAGGFDRRPSCHRDGFAEFFAELCAPETPIVPVCSSVLR